MNKLVYLDDVMELVDAYVLGFETHARLVSALNNLQPVEKEKRKSTNTNDELKISPSKEKK